jgi:DNA-damage-inducible protein J
MTHSTMLHVRADDEIKTQASEELELKVPNAQTRAAMEEARAMAKARAARFDTADALIDDLGKACQQ